MERKTGKDEQKNGWLFLLVFFLLSMGTVVLAILCVQGIKGAFVEKYFLFLGLAICAFVGLMCGVSVWATLTRREILQKSLLSGYVFLLFSLAVWAILQKSGFFEVLQSAESLQAYLERTGVWMPILYVLLQFLQVVILPIPSVVSTVAGVALFGALRATAYSLIGILLGSFLAFFIGRKLGDPAVSWLVGKETLRKWRRKMKGKDNLFLTLMFALPLFPDDILCFLAGLSTMPTGYFILMITICRFCAVAATCYSIDFIPFNTWWGIVLWGIFLAIIILVFVLVYRNLDKLQKIFKRKNDK